jgi:hypothetical protein
VDYGIDLPENWESFVRAAQQIEKEYLIELEKNKKLNAELQLVRAECDAIRRQYVEEYHRAQELEALQKTSSGGKKKKTASPSSTLGSEVKKLLQNLKEETERLKSIHPLQDLFNAKQIEIDRMKKALKIVSKEHPDRTAMESLVKAHIIERDELRELIQEAEERFRAQLDRIRNVEWLEQGVSTDPSSEAFGTNPLQVPEH